MLILGIETSCDETSVALVEDGTRIITNDIASQVKMHAAFGGVVPELASRAHMQRTVPMVKECLERNGLKLSDLDAIAVTLGPGLVGALLVGVETAKGLAFAARKPLIPVHHVAGHLYSPFLQGSADKHNLVLIGDAGEADAQREHARVIETQKAAPLQFPYVGLVVSGGHSSLVLVTAATEFRLLGETVDDAAGEAFDKFAKILELGYPGGPLVDRHARGGNVSRFPLPRPMLGRGNHSLDFSFSGLKTAGLKLVRDLGGVEAIKSDASLLSDICASFQEAIIEVLLKKAAAALMSTGTTHLAIVGGVACNHRLREAISQYLPPTVVAFIPEPILCTDNAAMIAGLAYHYRHRYNGCDLTLNARADLPLIPSSNESDWSAVPN